MSGVPLESYNIDSIPPRPEHHLHNTNERLPGAQGAASTVDYSPETIEHLPASVLKDDSTQHDAHSTTPHHTKTTAHHTTPHTTSEHAASHIHHTTPHDSTTHHPTSHTGLDSTKHSNDGAKGKTAFNEERPLDVKPTPAGKSLLPS